MRHRLLLLLLLPALATRAQEPPALMIRAYDVSDFILPARPDDQPDPTPQRLSADAPIGGRSITRSEAREQLASLLQETVDPSSWAPSGPGTLEAGDRAFVVAQSVENHRALGNLFSQLRDRSAETARLQDTFDAARLPAATRFDKAPLADALAAIAKVAGVPFEPDWNSLAKANLRPDTAVTADVSSLRAPRALQALLHAAGLPAGTEFNSWVDDESKTVQITAAPAPPPHEVSSRVYDVRRLPARAAGLDPARDHPRQEVLDALVATVQRHANVTAVRETGGVLIVTAPATAHQRVMRFLDRFDGPQPAPPKP